MKKSIFIFLFALLFHSADAQQKDSVYSFSIKQAIDFAINNQKEVINAKLDEDIARFKLRETVGIGLPQLSASFDIKDFEKIPVSLIPGEFFGEPEGTFIPVQFGTKWNATAALNASQLIFDPSYLVGISASKAYRELSRKNLERTKIETAVAVTKAYYSVLLLRERKKVLDANTARIKKLSGDTKAMFDNGFVEKIDADRVQVAQNNIISENENFSRYMELSEKLLRFQMGLPQQAKIELTDSLNTEAVKSIVATADNPDPSKRIEYSILKSQERLQEYNLKRYRSQYWPSIVAYGSLQTNAQRSEFNIFESGYKWYPTGIIGATLSINLFDGAQREAKIRQENLTLKKINQEVLNFEQAIQLEVSRNRSSLMDAISSLEIQEMNLGLATSVSTITKLKYDQGVGSNLEVLDAETSLKEAQVNYFNALFNAVIAKIDLDRSLGNFNY